MNIRTKHIAMLGFFLGWFCSGCGRSVVEPAVPVPSDCQEFLVKFFEAVKAKDVEKIKEFNSYVSHAASERMPEESVKMMRETKKQFAAEVFERMTKQLGDVQGYTVVSANVSTFTKAELAAKKMQESGLEGIHADIICKVKCSKKHSAVVNLNLFKETQESEYSVGAWRFESEP